MRQGIARRRQQDHKRREVFEQRPHLARSPSSLRRPGCAPKWRNHSCAGPRQAMAAPLSLAYDFGVAPRPAEANLIKSWRRMGDRAIVVLEILGVTPALERELVGEEDKVWLSVKGRADGREAIGAHLC